MNKQCIDCADEKCLKEFNKDKYTKDGYKAVCRECERIRRYKKEGKEPPNKITYFDDGGNKWCAKCKDFLDVSEFYLDRNNCFSSYCIPCSNKSCRENYNAEEAKIYNKKYREKNKEYLNLKTKEWNERNKERISENKRLYYIENKTDISEKKAQRTKIRYKTEPVFRMKENYRRRLQRLFSGEYKKSKKTEEILGCNVNFFKQHIESQFESWMSWDNYGKYDGNYKTGWDLDHIIPISWATTEEDIHFLNHWSNFQPLCSKVNRDEKRNK